MKFNLKAKVLENPKFNVYDIIAIKPGKIDHLGIISQRLNIDLIQIDESYLNNSTLNKINEIIRRGIPLEVHYGNVLSTGMKNEYTSFMNFMTSVARFTKGKGIILSNGTKNVSSIRSPYDVSNITCMIGFEYSIGKNMISKNCRESIMHGEQRRTYKGTIKIISKDK